MERLWIDEIDFNFDVEKTSKLHPKGTREYRADYLEQNKHLLFAKKRLWNVRSITEVGKKVLSGGLFVNNYFSFSYDRLIILSNDPKIFKYVNCKLSESNIGYLFPNTFYEKIWLTFDVNNNVISIFK
jgi:hypothetical protein